MQIALFWLLFILFITTSRCVPLSERTLQEDNNEDDNINCSDERISLNFSNVGLNNISPNFIASSFTTCLNLQNNGIQTISASAFDKLPNLTYLDLSNNVWRKQQMLSAGGHTNLKTLILDNVFEYNSRLSMEMKGSYPALEKLYLRNNDLRYLYGSSEANFSKLTHLYLSNNLIEIVGMNYGSAYSTNNYDFSWLPQSLKHLDINNNQLNSLNLMNLNNLKFLSVSNNLLKSISLKNLNKLKHFSGNRNEIKSLSYREFYDTPELEHLNLAENKITDFDGRIVDFIPTLLNLSLDNNLLTVTPDIVNAPNLKILSLRCNQIEKLGSRNFNGLRKLQELHLDDNAINEINSDTFSQLENLEILSLGRNYLVNLPVDWMIKLKNLRFLNLEGNKFTNLEALQMYDTPLLMQLYLQNNPLEYLRAHSLDAVPENVTIQLDPSLSILSKCIRRNNY